MDRSDAGDSFLTVAEVAETLKLNQQTVRNWIDQGSLPALRVGRLVRIRRADFESLIAGSVTGGQSAKSPSPSAQDFWDGEPVGVAEQAPGSADGASAREQDTASATHPQSAEQHTE